MYDSLIDTYFGTLKRTLDSLDRREVSDFIQALLAARDAGKQIFVMGNGGSAATASHMVCDFNKGLVADGKPRFKFICLNDNMATLMAYANDVSYDDVFVEPLKNFMQPGDLVIGISGSGNSTNVVRAIEWANDNGGKTFSLVGYSGGKLKQTSQRSIHADIENMQIVEDIHIILNHMIMYVVRENKI